MRTTIRDNYTPELGQYHEQILVDPTRRKTWLFDCDGVFTDITKVTVVSERGDSEEYAASQEWLTHELEALEAADETLQDNIDAEAATREADDRTLQDNIDAEETDRIAADREIWNEIEALEAASDVVDIVGTYAELENYDTSALKDNDIIKVLQDETHDNAIAYYRWNATDDTFTFVGVEGPYYTASETDTLLAGKQDKLIAGNNIQIAADGKTISATDTTYTRFTGATSSADGVQGLVPVPLAGDQNKVLKGDGTWGDASAYTLPPATTTTLGGVIVGNNLTVDANGVLNATGTAYTLPTASAATLGGVKVGNNLSIDADGVLSTHAPYTLPTASASTLGGIKVGSNLSIDADGVLSATASPTLYSTTGQNTDGAMTQKAITDMVFIPGYDPSTASVLNRISIGSRNTNARPSDGHIGIGWFWNEGWNSIAIGHSVEAYSNYCVALGGSSPTSTNTVAGVYGGGDNGGLATALGTGAMANATGSVALGAMSKVGGVSYVVSVGSGEANDSATYQHRRIVNVADAVDAHDAVTKGQLDAVVASIPATNNINSTDWNALWQ